MSGFDVLYPGVDGSVGTAALRETEIKRVAQMGREKTIRRICGRQE